MSPDLGPVPSPAAPVIVVGGGQSGLAAARALQELRMPTVILEASDRPAGSWPCYYDSLRLFSPAGYSSMPGMPFPGAPDRYPGRDEVAGYLERYAARLGVEIRTRTRVQTVRQDGREFIVVPDRGRTLRASGIVAASGSFSSPYRPSFPGEEGFTGGLSHVADYRNPAPYAGQRVIVVGAGDSAAQVANELAPVAAVTLATRHPVRFIPQRLGGQDVHYYLRELGALDADAAPIHVRGISSTHVGLVYLGLEYQRSFASNTLRGVSADARAVIGPLVAWIRDAPAKVGLGARDYVDTYQSEWQVHRYGRGTRADSEDQAPRRRTAVRADRLPRGAARAGGPPGRGRQGPRRPRPAAAH